MCQFFFYTDDSSSNIENKNNFVVKIFWMVFYLDKMSNLESLHFENNYFMAVAVDADYL